MIFVGWALSDANSHFVTNVVDSIGSEHDLIVDLQRVRDWAEIVLMIKRHCSRVLEEFIIYNAHTCESLPLCLKREFPALKLITIFSDDEWRHDSYDRYLALFADVCTVTDRNNIERYRSYGLQHVHYMGWKCNAALFHPIAGLEPIHDVTFIGAAYGKRIDYVRYLLRAGVPLKVFGQGWGRFHDVREHWGGVLSRLDMIRVISESRINLNFLWTSGGDRITTVKGRTLELAACGAFQLSNHTDDFANYGFIPDDNIAVFRDRNDLLEKIHHYLAHPRQRQDIAEKGYRHVLSQHTWPAAFDELFARFRLGELQPPTLPRFKLLVIVANGVRHDVHTDDPRLEVEIITERDCVQEFGIYHGVIRLDCSSTMNNDALYMMAFGIHADKAAGVLANFYLGRHWIRFRDQAILRKRSLARMLPQTCFMVSGGVWGRHCQTLADPYSKIAFIEYPAFSIDLPSMRSRFLRLFFCDHGDARERIRHSWRTGQLGGMLSILADRIWQKIVLGA